MTAAPFVSVILPTYNRATLISQTIHNIFEQTYTDFELIVVDDGSTDNTRETLKSFGSRIRLIRQDNAGPSIARNRGAEAARGQVIAFQDSDDLWLPTKLERQMALLTKYGRSIPCCLCNARMENASRREWTSFEESCVRVLHEEGLWSNVLEVLATRFILFNQTAMMWRSVFEKVGGFPEDIRYLEDYDLPLRLALEGPWALIRKPLVIYRENTPESFSQEAQRNLIPLRECAVKIFERTLERAGTGPSRMYLMHRLRLLRRALYATKCIQSDSGSKRALGRAIVGVDRYYNAAFRRSPWFPQPVTRAAQETAPMRLDVLGERS